MKVNNPQRLCNVTATFDLFTWASERDRRSSRPTPAARWIMRRHPMDSTRAELLANLAGLGVRP